MISPLRLLAIGLASEDVSALYGISLEELELLAEAAEMRRKPVPASAGRTLMTPLLARPDMERWETQTTERL